MKELLKQCAEVIHFIDDSQPILKSIETELSCHVEPVAWCNGDIIIPSELPPGLSIDLEVWRPLFAHPPAKPVLLSYDDVWDAYTKSTLQVMNSEQDDITSFAQEIEQAVLRKNGLGGVE